MVKTYAYLRFFLFGKKHVFRNRNHRTHRNQDGEARPPGGTGTVRWRMMAALKNRLSKFSPVFSNDECGESLPNHCFIYFNKLLGSMYLDVSGWFWMYHLRISQISLLLGAKFGPLYSRSLPSLPFLCNLLFEPRWSCQPTPTYRLQKIYVSLWQRLSIAFQTISERFCFMIVSVVVCIPHSYPICCC